MDVTLVSAEGPELSRLKTKPNLRHTAINFSRSINPWHDLTSLFQLYLLLRKNKFDIVHSTTPKAGLITAIAAFFARIPIRLHSFTGQPWVTLREPTRSVARTADRLIGLLNTGCYADSESQRRFLIEEKIIAAKKIKLIGHGSLAGIDLDRFCATHWRAEQKTALRQELSISPSSQIILFIGRITRDKGVLELLDTAKALTAAGYDTDLLLVGPLDEECGGNASVPYNKLKSQPRIHYLGYSETPENYLAIADILCLPSYREGFGTVIIEAAAMSVPAVGTRINGLIDAIADGETGILVPPRNSDALFKAIQYLLDTPDTRSRMGIAAQQRCVKQFDATIVNKNLVAEYQELLEKMVKRTQPPRQKITGN